MSASFNPHRIRRQSLPELVAEAIRSRILSGDLKDGDALVQESVATDFGVSRMPVREAFRQLEAAGLIRRDAGRGAVVAAVPTEQITELFDIRVALEPQALRHAVERTDLACLAASREALVALEAAYRNGDVSRWGDLNWEFHESLYRPSGRIQTLNLLKGVHLQIDRFIRLQLVLGRDLADAEADHRELLRLTEERRAGEAVDLLERHIGKARDRLLSALPKRSDAGPEPIP